MFIATAAWASAGIYFMTKSDGGCTDEHRIDWKMSIIPRITVDTLINILLVYLFISRLSVLIRMQTDLCIPVTNPQMESGRAKSAVDLNPQQLSVAKEMIFSMTKLTLLACTAVVCSWINLLFLTVAPGIVDMLDVLMGTICVLFCFEFHKSQYMKYCFLCRQCCYRVCFWWFLSSDYLCHQMEEEDDHNSYGCCNCKLLCFFASQDAVIATSQRGFTERGDLECLSPIAESPTKTSKNSQTDNQTEPSPDGVTVTIKVDSASATDDGDGNGSDEATPATPIKPEPLDRFTPNTPGIVQTPYTPYTPHTPHTPVFISPNSNPKSFSYRAALLKNLQCELAHEEGVDGDWHHLKWTLKSSQKEWAKAKTPKGGRTDRSRSENVQNSSEEKKLKQPPPKAVKSFSADTY